MAPPPRQIIQRNQSTLSSEDSKDPGAFSVLCYNVLCPQFASPALYHYTPSWALPWEYRRNIIMDEIRLYSCEFVCLQEVDWNIYDYWLRGEMKKEGYEGVYCPSWVKSLPRSQRDGVAIFWKAQRYGLVRNHPLEFSNLANHRKDFKSSKDVPSRLLKRGNVANICLFRDLTTQKHLLLTNTHIYWDPEFCDVKLVQTGLLIEEITKVAERFQQELTEASDLPIILCGDFNSLPNSGVYKFLSSGSVARDHPDLKKKHYGSFTKRGMAYGLRLRSAYSSTSVSPSREDGTTDPELLPWTNYTAHFKGVLDYIWYSQETLQANSYLGGIDPDYLEAGKVIGFPHAHIPSDHIPIMTEFTWKASTNANR
ncbi:Glucose-repressible alcohol dehydrogenase transcriptional effector [Marasmius sp. AFHP31]|nr:Glucose-repressible alcohol dehydrogenase transcriptional effector [Marasmius sp. AFHP31]